MIAFEILLWMTFLISIAFSAYMVIFAIIDDIRLRSIRKYLTSVGYKEDWIFIAFTYYRGFSKDSDSDYILWKDLNKLSLKQVKEIYK